MHRQIDPEQEREWARVKMQRDQLSRLTSAWEEGWEQGLKIGKIQAYQELLQQPITALQQLRELPVEQLEQLFQKLRAQLIR